MITDTKKLIKDIRAFMRRHKMRPSTFGRNALNNPAFLKTDNGSLVLTTSPKLTTVDRLKEYMHEKDLELLRGRYES